MQIWAPIFLSLWVSAAATLLGTLAGVSAAAVLALGVFPGRGVLVVAVNALLGLPPVVVGLVFYLLLSHSGPLGDLGLLFTPTAMVLAQAALAAPIICALVHRSLEHSWAEFGPPLRVLGATRLRALPVLLGMSRRAVATAILAGFGRCLSEVGAVLIVGGNILGHTRSLTTSIVLQTAMGNLDTSLLLGLVLVGVSVAVSAGGIALGGARL